MGFPESDDSGVTDPYVDACDQPLLDSTEKRAD